MLALVLASAGVIDGGAPPPLVRTLAMAVTVMPVASKSARTAAAVVPEGRLPAYTRNGCEEDEGGSTTPPTEASEGADDANRTAFVAPPPPPEEEEPRQAFVAVPGASALAEVDRPTPVALANAPASEL